MPKQIKAWAARGADTYHDTRDDAEESECVWALAVLRTPKSRSETVGEAIVRADVMLAIRVLAERVGLLDPDNESEAD